MPPAGRAPPCTRWGASRPPDPGITADAKGFRIQLALISLIDHREPPGDAAGQQHTEKIAENKGKAHVLDTFQIYVAGYHPDIPKGRHLRILITDKVFTSMKPLYAAIGIAELKTFQICLLGSEKYHAALLVN